MQCSMKPIIQGIKRLEMKNMVHRRLKEVVISSLKNGKLNLLNHNVTMDVVGTIRYAQVGIEGLLPDAELYNVHWHRGCIEPCAAREDCRMMNHVVWSGA